MKKLFEMMKAAMSTVMSSTTWVWERCVDTGRLLGKLVMSPIAALDSLGSGVAMPIEPEITEDQERNQRETSAELERMQTVKVLAAEILGDCVKPEHAKSVSPRVMAWLSVLDRKALARVTCAEPRVLAAHIRGQRHIDGVASADSETVAQIRAAYQMKMRETRRKAMESNAETEALLERGRKLLERDPENPHPPGYAI